MRKQGQERQHCDELQLGIVLSVRHSLRQGMQFEVEVTDEH
jgi:hypothetical protein